MIKLVAIGGREYWIAPHAVAAVFSDKAEVEVTGIILNQGGGTLRVVGKPEDVAEVVRKATLQFSVDVARATADALVKDAT